MHAGLESPTTLKLGLTQASRKLQETVGFLETNIFDNDDDNEGLVSSKVLEDLGKTQKRCGD